MTTTTTTHENELGTFHNLSVPHQMWAAMGADVTSYGNAQARIDWGGGTNGDRRKAYAIELLERSKASGQSDPEAIVRQAIVLYAEDRPARAHQDLASAIREFGVRLENKRFTVTHVGLERLADAIDQLGRNARR